MAVEITSLTGYAASTFLANNSGATALECVAGTGTGNVVRATSPTLVTPALGTPSSGTLTSCTGLPISTGVSGLGSGVATLLATFSSANLAAALTDETGSGANVFGTSPTLATPVINVGSDATGDIYYRNSGGAFTRLAIGTTGQVLNVGGSGIPAWATSSGGGNAQTANPLSQFADGAAPVISGLTLSDSSIVFEGSSADAYETTLTVTNPTADRTVTIPDASFTVVGRDTTDTLTNKTLSNATFSGTQAGDKVEIGIACSDETTAITTGTAKVTFRMPYAMTLTAVRANVNTAPTGSTILIDINEGGTTVLSTKLMIDASEKTSTTATTAYVISDSALADDAEITIDFDQVGSTIAGKGVKVWLIGTR